MYTFSDEQWNAIQPAAAEMAPESTAVVRYGLLHDDDDDSKRVSFIMAWSQGHETV